MFEFIERWFGRQRVPDIVPAGTRSDVAFAWHEPDEGGEPTEADCDTIRRALLAAGWPDVDVESLGYAAAFVSVRDGIELRLELGHDGDGPWAGHVELTGSAPHADASAWVQGIHRLLVQSGATNLRWFEGDRSDPWPEPVAP